MHQARQRLEILSGHEDADKNSNITKRRGNLTNCSCWNFGKQRYRADYDTLFFRDSTNILPCHRLVMYQVQTATCEALSFIQDPALFISSASLGAYRAHGSWHRYMQIWHWQVHFPAMTGCPFQTERAGAETSDFIHACLVLASRVLLDCKL